MSDGPPARALPKTEAATVDDSVLGGEQRSLRAEPFRNPMACRRQAAGAAVCTEAKRIRPGFPI